MPKANKHAYGVIMAGGGGQRFWPLSRQDQPKQCLPILGKESMLQQAARRLTAFLPKRNVLVATRRGIEKTVARQLPQLPAQNIVAEPCGRDTAACIALAACLLLRRDRDAIMVIVPSDHVVGRPQVLTRLIQDGLALAQKEEALIVSGVPPWEPATGYGYIQAGKIFRRVGDRNFYHVARYHEKPDLTTARNFLAAGTYWWNSGGFIWKARTIVEEIQKYIPQHGRMCKDLLKAKTEATFWSVVSKQYPRLPKISIDYGVLEKSDRVLTASADFGWDDMGSWTALARYLPAGPNNNSVVGDALILEGQGNLVRSDKGHFVGLLGTNDLVVIHTPDATLVCPKSKVQEIKKLVEVLKKDPKRKRLT